MIKLYSRDHIALGLLANAADVSVTSTLSTGDKMIEFDYSCIAAFADEISNECYLRTENDEFVIKEVSYNTGDNNIHIVANLNLEDLEGKEYESFETVETLPADCLAAALEGTGWSVGKCDISKRRTIRKDSTCNVLDIISQMLSTYSAEVKYNTTDKTVSLYTHIGEDKGCYFIESLNLRKIGYEKTTNDFYTRIVPIGKDGLKIDIDGKDYLENHTYSKKIKTHIWKDERYTKVESLIEDAKIKLDEMAKPYETYEADVVDLAAQSKDYKGILNYDIGDTVWLISRKTGIKEKMRIVKIVKYPNDEKKNVCEFANTKKTFASVQEKWTEQIVDEKVGETKSDLTEYIDDQVKSESQSRNEIVEELNEKINNSSGLYQTEKLQEDGSTIRYLHDKPSLDKSSTVISLTKDAVGISEDGGKTYKYAISFDGTAILNRIYAEGIDASYIKAGTLSADKISGGTIDAKDVTIENLDASEITSGTLSADRISGGTIDAEDVRIKNLDASEITSGTLSADRISGGTIDAKDVTIENLSASDITTGALTVRKNGNVLFNADFDSGSVEINGVVKASSGKIGGWEIYGSYLGSNSGTIKLNGDFDSIECGQQRSGNYTIISAGQLYSECATLTGQFIGTFIQGSDKNIKNSIEDMPDKYRRLLYKLRPVTFRYNSEDSGQRHAGLIAQEVEQAMKECGIDGIEYGGFVQSEQGPCGVQYNEITPLLIAEVQRFDARITKLENIIAEQQEEIQRLKKTICGGESA